MLPEGFGLPKERKKPWGTAHAIFVAKEKINSPFAVINADDFYGRSAFGDLKKALDRIKNIGDRYFMIGYKLVNTLSKHGGVSRGWCRLKEDQLLSVSETTDIRKINNQIVGLLNGGEIDLKPDEIVSMNFWGFSPSIFPVLEAEFKHFLETQLNNPKSEFFITDVIDCVIKHGSAIVSVLKTDEKWFGVTFKEDRDEVNIGIREVQN